MRQAARKQAQLSRVQRELVSQWILRTSGIGWGLWDFSSDHDWSRYNHSCHFSRWLSPERWARLRRSCPWSSASSSRLYNRPANRCPHQFCSYNRSLGN